MLSSRFSIVIPAHNEEQQIGGCLDSIKHAQEALNRKVETVVVLNRCSDRTEAIAIDFGAKIVREDAKNLSKIRNAGVAATTGDIVVTIDADSRMSRNTLTEIERLLSTGKFVGGGTRIIPERISLGILASSLVVLYYAIRFGLKSAGLFWCFKKDFEAIGGFDESLVSLEDFDFANRLAAYGTKKNLRYGTTWRAFITTSCRKFDRYGDWYFFINPSIVKALFTGLDRTQANRLYYDFKR